MICSFVDCTGTLNHYFLTNNNNVRFQAIRRTLLIKRLRMMHLHWNIYILLSVRVLVFHLQSHLSNCSISFYRLPSDSLQKYTTRLEYKRDEMESKLHATFIWTYYAFDVIKFCRAVFFFYSVHSTLFTMRMVLVLQFVLLSFLWCYFPLCEDATSYSMQDMYV